MVDYTPVCSSCHHQCAGTGHVRAMSDEKERQASCFLPQEAKQARGMVALDRENSTRSRQCWPGPQAWASKPPAPPTILCAVSSGMRWGVRNTEAPSQPHGYQDSQHGGRKDMLTFRNILPPKL